MRYHSENTDRRWTAAVLLGIAGLLEAAPAAAQDDASEAARALLIDEARAAAVRGDHRGAASFAERALVIENTPSLRLFLAEQWIALGRDVEALAQVERCRREANPGRRQEAIVRRNCEVLRRTLVERLAVLQLRVEPDGAEATTDGRLVPTNGAPVAVPAGAVTLRVSLAGFHPYQDLLTLARGETREVAVNLRPLPRTTPVVEPVSPLATRPVEAPRLAPSPHPITARPTSWRPPWSSVVWMASGVALLAVVTPVLVWQRDELSSRCARTADDDLHCPDNTAFQDATTANDVLHPAAIATGVAGGVSLFVGAAWWWWRAARGASSAPRVSLLPLPRGAAMALTF